MKLLGSVSLNKIIIKVRNYFLNSVKTKIVSGGILLFLFVLFINGSVLLLIEKDNSYKHFIKMTEFTSDLIVKTHLLENQNVNDSLLSEIIIKYNKISDIKALAIYDSKNRLFASASRKIQAMEDQNIYFSQLYFENNQKLDDRSEYAWFYYTKNYTSGLKEQNKFVMLIANSSYLDNTNNSRFILTILAIVSLLISIPILIYYGKKISKTLDDLTNKLEEKSIIEVQNKLKFNSFMEIELQQLTINIYNKISDLLMIIERYKSNGNVIKELSNNLSENISLFSAAIIQQGSATSQTTSAFEELGISIKTISESAESIVTVADKTKLFSEEGVVAAVETVNKIIKIHESNVIIREKLVELGSKSHRIANILKAIDELNDQTKLISFNAMIEAVGAGDNGRRFKIVASEIKELSDNLEKRSKLIKSILLEISDHIQEVIEENRKIDPIITNSLTSGELLTIKLKAINEYAHITNDNIKNIHHATEQQGKAVNEVILSMREVAIGSETFIEGSFKIKGVADKLHAISNEIIV